MAKGPILQSGLERRREELGLEQQGEIMILKRTDEMRSIAGSHGVGSSDVAGL